MLLFLFVKLILFFKLNLLEKDKLVLFNWNLFRFGIFFKMEFKFRGLNLYLNLSLFLKLILKFLLFNNLLMFNDFFVNSNLGFVRIS